MEVKTLQAFESFTNFGYCMGVSPYRVLKSLRIKNGKSDGVVVCRTWIFDGSLRRKMWMWLLLALDGLYQLFLIGRFLQTYLDDGLSPARKIKIFYLTTIFTLVNWGHWVTWANFGHHGTSINAFLRTLSNLQRKICSSLNQTQEFHQSFI
jgi:hypothetical protein